MLGIECCLPEQSFHCCDVVSACPSGEVLPVCSMHLHGSQSTFTPAWWDGLLTDCTGCWVLSILYPRATPPAACSLVSWGWEWGLSNQLLGHCWWESRFCFTKSANTFCFTEFRTQWSLLTFKIISQQDNCLNFFQRIYPREKAKDKNTQTGVWLGASPVLSICKALCSNLGEKKDITSNYRCASVDLGKETKAD